MMKIMKNSLVNSILIFNFNCFSTVLDLHPEWSGPCDLMNPTYKSLSTQIDDFEKRIDILSVVIFLFIYLFKDGYRKTQKL